MTWDAALYQQTFAFVPAMGRGLLPLLDARPGERVLDLGCGTGELTVELARSGASVVGVDADPAMLARAAQAAEALQAEETPGDGSAHTHPDAGAAAVTWRLADAHALPDDLTADGPFDAVLSNATLHWMRDPAHVLSEVRRVLRPGGRFVAEQGGRGNVAAVLAAAADTRAARGLPPVAHPWDFPSPAEQATRLERAGFRVRSVHWFERPSPLGDGGTAGTWLRMFGSSLLAGVADDERTGFLDEVDERAAAQLRAADGSWHVDYVRLRFVAEAV